jgi:hypothetical protein
LDDPTEPEMPDGADDDVGIVAQSTVEQPHD